MVPLLQFVFVRVWFHSLPSRKHAYIILTPLTPHHCIVKLGFTGVCIFFLILLKNIDCGYSLTSTDNLCFEQKYEKYQSSLSEIFQLFEVKFSIYFNRRIFVMVCFVIVCSSSSPSFVVSEGCASRLAFSGYLRLFFLYAFLSIVPLLKRGLL